MIKIYDAGNITEAHIVRGMLVAHGVEAWVGGHYLQGGVGELPPQDFASVHVIDDDEALARELIEDYEQGETRDHATGRDAGGGAGAWLNVLFFAAAFLLVMAIVYFLSAAD